MGFLTGDWIGTGDLGLGTSDFAFVTYADLPRGAIKNNSMRRLAATTLMEILPPHIAERVNKKMEEDPSSSHDFLSLVGLVSYYGAGEEN